jgi:transposase
MARPVYLSAKERPLGIKLMEEHKPDKEFRRGLIVTLMADNRYKAEEIASLLSISVRTVFEELSRIRKPSSYETTGTWGGRRRSLMTYSQEEAFLDKYLEQAEEGTILTIPELHVAFNEEVGKITAKSSIYDLLSRHEWRKVKSDARHPKGDPVLQEEFKIKCSRFDWQKKKK